MALAWTAPWIVNVHTGMWKSEVLNAIDGQNLQERKHVFHEYAL